MFFSEIFWDIRILSSNNLTPCSVSLRENESVIKTILACLSGAQVQRIHEEKMAKKSCDTSTFRAKWKLFLHLLE